MTSDILLLEIVNVVLFAAIFFLALMLRRRSKELHNARAKANDLKRVIEEKGYYTCCLCGKPYDALNNPEYSPELNICRDCMWKMYYERTFGPGEGDA